MDQIQLMIWSPAIALILSALLFIVVTRTRNKSIRNAYDNFLKYLFLSAVPCFGITFVIVAMDTAISDNPQGPLSLIYLGPASIAVGTIVGTVLWIRREINT